MVQQLPCQLLAAGPTQATRCYLTCKLKNYHAIYKQENSEPDTQFFVKSKDVFLLRVQL